MFLDMLRLIFDTCCMQCTKLTFKTAESQLSMLFDRNLTLGMPFESSTSSDRVSEQHYVNFVQSHKTMFLARQKSNLGIELTKSLLLSVLNTWPLLVTAFLMAVIAGCIVWLLVSFTNI